MFCRPAQSVRLMLECAASIGSSAPPLTRCSLKIMAGALIALLCGLAGPCRAAQPAAASVSQMLSMQPGFSAAPPTPGYLPPQPSLGYSTPLVPGLLGPKNLAPFLEVRLRLEVHPSRGFGELSTVDPGALLGRLRAGLAWWDHNDTALAQFQAAGTTGLESNAPTSNKHLDVHQLWYNRSRLFGMGDARVGRQELSFGNERMIGPANFSQPGRTWDGIRLQYGSLGRTADAFYTHTVNFQTPQAMFWFSGLWGKWTSPQTGEINLYFLHKGNDQGVALHRNTIGALWRYNPVPSVDMELQGNGQVGSEAGKDVGASSGRAVFAERVGVPRSMGRLLRGLTFYQEGEYASGSGASSGDAATFDQLFPTTHGKWGQIDYQGWRNMTEIRLGASTTPARNWLTGIDYYDFGLASPHDFWYRTNGSPFFTPMQQNRTKDYGVHTGQEADFTATWKASQRINWQGDFSLFFPGDFVKNVTHKAGTSAFFYLQGSYSY